MGFLKPKVHPRLSITGQEIAVSFLFQRPFMVRSPLPPPQVLYVGGFGLICE